eukprot:g33856.t1
MGRVERIVEEANDEHVIRGVGGGIKMDDNRKVRLVGTCRAEMPCKLVPESAFGLLDIEETTSGATDAIVVSQFLEMETERSRREREVSEIVQVNLRVRWEVLVKLMNCLSSNAVIKIAEKEEIAMGGAGLGIYQIRSCEWEIFQSDEVVDGLGYDGLVIGGGAMIDGTVGGGVREWASGISDVEEERETID